LDIVHVKDATASTLKKKISFVLSHHNLDVQNIRGQGYDGASNMVKSGMDCKFYSLMIALMHIMYTV